MLEKLKIRVYDVLVETDDDEVVDKIIAVMLMILIIINSVAVVLETVDELNETYGALFRAIELVSVAIFTVEYLLRLWIAPLDARYRKPLTADCAMPPRRSPSSICWRFCPRFCR
jgi:voltage-gated potassium channel